MAEEKREKREMNANVDYGKEAFYANGVTVITAPNEVVLDFSQALQRTDSFIDNPQINTIAVRHHAVVIQFMMLKMLTLILKDEVDRLEKAVGEIKLPPNWRAKDVRGASASSGEKPSY